MSNKRISSYSNNSNKKVIISSGKEDITTKLKAVKKIFSKNYINRLAENVGFVQRQRKLEAYDFFISLSFGALFSAKVTLSGILETVTKNITRASIQERFNENACKFMEKVYSYIYKKISANKQLIDVGILNKFNHINIVDSSSWKIPRKLKEVFPGYNEAGCKIQLMLEYKTGGMHLLDITKESYNDQQYSKTLDKYIKPNDLILFDLAYSIIETLKKIDQKNAFFMSRYSDKSMNLYIKEEDAFCRIDILELVKKIKNSSTILDLDCYLGNSKHKIKIRFLALRVKEEVANTRRRKLRKKSQKRGRVPTKRRLEMCNWTFFVTNIDEGKGLDVREIISLYPIRWSIEIFFKQLKGVLNIHKTEVKNNADRLRCEVLGKCIVALFITYCYGIARRHTWQKEQIEISFEKTVKYFKRAIMKLFYLFFKPVQHMLDRMKEMIITIICSCKKYRQKSRKNTLDMLLSQCVYGKSEYTYIKVGGLT